jgi:hypothetical protein
VSDDANRGVQGGRPDEPTVFYDPLSYAAFDHPYELYRELRERAPVYYNRRRDLWVLSRYDDVKACLTNHQQFVNTMGNDVDETHDTYGPGQLIALDPPHHGRVRAVLSPPCGVAAGSHRCAPRPRGWPPRVAVSLPGCDGRAGLLRRPGRSSRGPGIAAPGRG